MMNHAGSAIRWQGVIDKAAYDGVPGAHDLGAHDLLERRDLDPLTHTRLWENPCWFSSRFNYLSLRYNLPLYGWVEKRFGLSRVEFAVIYLLGLKNGVTASAICVASGFPKNTMSRAVNALLGRGLIGRDEDPADRRSRILALKESGRAVFEEALPRFLEMERQMLRTLTLQEREMLSVLLAKVVLDTFDMPAVAETVQAARVRAAE
jgi:MarR family transcriptional regulator, temperature-dependent positive regulator of motility